MRSLNSTFSNNNHMIFFVILVLLLGYFFLMGFPNAAASEDARMIMIFEPDEGVPLPYALDMIKPADNLKQTLVNFIDYNYYFYGYPYFAYSAFILLPLKLSNNLDNYSLIMLFLRQFVSVLPMLGAIYLLIRMSDNSRHNWVSIVMLMVLLAIPGVMRNNFWWHPDSLVTFFVVVTIYLLYKDDLKIGNNFLWAAFFCGVATGIKYTGLFFVLTIPVYLLWAGFSKKVSFKKMILMGLLFVLIMIATIILSNPLLLNPSVRQRYFEVFQQQSVLLSTGYNVIYSKGLWAGAQTVTENYGSWAFISLAIFAPILGIFRNKNRLLGVLILTWAIPLSTFTLIGSHIKFQYLLPVALPLFSTLTYYLDDLKKLDSSYLKQERLNPLWASLSILAIIIIVTHLTVFIKQDFKLFTDRLLREETSPSITFYNETLPNLGELADEKLYVYHDVRLYVPDKSPWRTVSNFKLLTYEFFEKENPAIILLMEQRIRDYLNPNVEAIDEELLQKSRMFYRDADQENINGYTLVFRNAFGLSFVRDDIYQEYLEP